MKDLCTLQRHEGQMLVTDHSNEGPWKASHEQIQRRTQLAPEAPARVLIAYLCVIVGNAKHGTWDYRRDKKLYRSRCLAFEHITSRVLQCAFDSDTQVFTCLRLICSHKPTKLWKVPEYVNMPQTCCTPSQPKVRKPVTKIYMFYTPWVPVCKINY